MVRVAFTPLPQLSARNEERGRKAQQLLKEVDGLDVGFQQLDVEDDASVKAAAAAVQAAHGQLDVLVLNAGVAWRGDAFDDEVVSGTLSVNYFGLRRCFDAFLPLLRPPTADGSQRSRVVVVSSQAGSLHKVKAPLRKAFTNPQASLADMDKLVNDYIAAVRKGDYEDKGWPRHAYGVSKIAATQVSKVYARLNPEHLVFPMSPGWCVTDMTSPEAEKTAAEGADTVIYLATENAAALESGKFYYERKVKDSPNF